MADTLEVGMNELIQKLRNLPKQFTVQEQKRILEYAAVPLVDAAQNLAPVGSKTHYRYGTAKLTNQQRAPKGKGKRVATYHPGNLKGSIGILKHGVFRKLSPVYVGIKKGRRGASGTFGSSKFDGYYGHWVEAHHPFMRPAFEMTKAIVLKRITTGVQIKLKKYAAQIRV